ncbi:MAG: 5'/3'-nucleotidase SurE, partial [Planctomycetes bacterium]|nr:5'/3'-nucleotidase SurE [Planctomycetota bacterium]
MTILISNDDGIEAPGIAMLVEALAGIDELVVVAPRENRSGIGHAVTFDSPVKIEEMPPAPCGAQRIAVYGTPADSVKYAIKKHLIERPGLVVTGVNRGLNVGVNVLYSGTIGAAFEGLIHGINAVAVSASY